MTMANILTMKNWTDQSIGDWVLYKNNQLIAFNKPAGIPVQDDRTGDKSMMQLAAIYTKGKVELIHRLDRPASGALLMAKNKKSLAHLNEQFKQREVHKTYLAVVSNKPKKKEGRLVHHLLRDGRTNKSAAVPEGTSDSKRAELSYRLVAESDNYFLLEIELLTGRHHQIRAQLAAIDCPIKGDVKYGDRRRNPDRSIHLHAHTISFVHPVSGQTEKITAPLPADDNLWAFFAEQLD